MEVVRYSDHVKVSSLARGNSRGLERAGWSRSRPSLRPGLELPGLGSGPIGFFLKHSPTEPPGHSPIGHALIQKSAFFPLHSVRHLTWGFFPDVKLPFLAMRVVPSRYTPIRVNPSVTLQ
jgi:hypothetical protein